MRRRSRRSQDLQERARDCDSSLAKAVMNGIATLCCDDIADGANEEDGGDLEVCEVVVT